MAGRGDMVTLCFAPRTGGCCRAESGLWLIPDQPPVGQVTGLLWDSSLAAVWSKRKGLGVVESRGPIRKEYSRKSNHCISLVLPVPAYYPFDLIATI